ncbi:hypothetical protein LIER_39069 [Lithospermum erythrorhizon]|uniref:Uncharacterized protein n=1 Tax=Lithospermum erythrorhizon TaxID=34254 RepID=A0AAV3QDB3_LITER
MDAFALSALYMIKALNASYACTRREGIAAIGAGFSLDSPEAETPAEDIEARIEGGEVAEGEIDGADDEATS